MPGHDGGLAYRGRMTTGERSAERTGELAQLGPYRLRGRLGEGGMGVVHLGLDGAGRAVAVKVLRAHIAHDPDARARLAREVSTLRRVRHPLIAEVLDADVDGDQPYVVTRFVPGLALDAVVGEHGPLRPTSLLGLGRGLSSALGAIHAVGVVHRDLKPANVLLLDDSPVVIDFGIAHVADDVRLTSTGLVMGTPGYLSPEVIDGDRVTEATDWWGWAATLAFAASGRPPFGRGPMDVVLDRVRRGDCDLAGVDERLRPLLAAALAVDPRHRPVATEVLDALDRYAAGEQATCTLPVPAPNTRLLPQPATSPGAHPPQPQRPVVPVAAAVVPVLPPVALAQQPRPTPAGPDRRTGTVTAIGFMAVAVALLNPVVAGLLVLTLVALARTVDRNSTQLSRRRAEYGPRRTDVWAIALSSPWHLLTAAARTVVTAVPVVLLGGLTMLCVGVAVPTVGGSPQPESPVAVAVGAVVAVLTLWFGAGGGSLRRGTRLSLRAVVPRAQELPTAAVLAVLALLLALWAVQHGPVQWWPLTSVSVSVPQWLQP